MLVLNTVTFKYNFTENEIELLEKTLEQLIKYTKSLKGMIYLPYADFNYKYLRHIQSHILSDGHDYISAPSGQGCNSLLTDGRSVKFKHKISSPGGCLATIY